MHFQTLASENELANLDWISWLLALLPVLLTAVIVVIFFLILDKNDQKFFEKREEKVHYASIFVIDKQNKTVSYLRSKTLRDVEEFGFPTFYARFLDRERAGLEDWIDRLLDPKSETEIYREVYTVSKKSKRKVRILLKATFVNHEQRKIYLEGFLSKYCPPESGGEAKNSQNALTHYISAVMKRGATFCISFRYKRVSLRERPIDQQVMSQLKGVVFDTAEGQKRSLIQVSNNELILTDSRVQGQQAATRILDGVLNAVRRFFAINSLSSSIEVRAGVVEHAKFNDKPEKIILEAKRMALLSYETNVECTWYQKGRKSYHISNEANYLTEVERIINDHRLSFLFRPLFSVEKMETIGYLSDTRPMDAFFPSFEELKNYAERAGEGKNLFATTAKNVVSTFLSERISDDDILFYPVRVDEFAYLYEVFGAMEGRFDNDLISFLLSEDDIKTHLISMGVEGFISVISQLKAKGYKVSLLVNGSELSLPDAIYAEFDYYIVSFLFAGAATGINTKIRAELHALVERLIKYDRPIIASDIDGWNAIELLVRSGLNYISADVFAPYEPMITPIAQKSLKKIQEIKE